MTQIVYVVREYESNLQHHKESCECRQFVIMKFVIMSRICNITRNHVNVAKPTNLRW